MAAELESDEGDAERASELLEAMRGAGALELVSHAALAKLAVELGRFLVVGGDGLGRAREVADWLLEREEVVDVYVDDPGIEGYLAKHWDNRVVHSRPSAVPARHPELEALLAREPDELAHQLVYSDWLQAQQDPFGELIARRVAAFLAPADSTLADSAVVYQAQHGEALFGRLAEYLDLVVHLRWRGGFVHAARIGTEPGDPGPYQGAIMLRWLLERTPALLLRELELYPVDHHWTRDQHRELLEATLERPRPLLRRLAIVHPEGGGDAGRLPDDLRERLPGLEQLAVVVRTASAGALDHPRLETLIWAANPGLEFTAALAKAELPRLEQLELRAEFLPPALGPALARASLPSLRRLRIRADGLLLQAIASAPWREGIEVLELAGGSLTDEDARRLAGLVWPRLRRLDVSGNQLGPAGVDALAGLCGELVVGDQRGTVWDEDVEGDDGDADADDERDEDEDGDGDDYYGDIRE